MTEPTPDIHLPTTVIPDGADEHFLDDHCASCLKPLPELMTDGSPWLFCSSLCQQIADFVRYRRAKSLEGRLWEMDIWMTLQMKMAHIYAGGYNARERRLPATTRSEVIDRDGGRCIQCGEPGEEIDHIDGDSGDPGNLRLLCKSCHGAVTGSRMVPASQAQRDWAADLIATRCEPVLPRLLADSTEWQRAERTLRPARRRRMLAMLEDEGVEGPKPASGRTWADVADDLFEARAPADLTTEEGYGPDSQFARAMERDD